MRYFIDTEFIEYPCSIELISIGIKCEDERTFYAINNEFDSTKASDWVKEHVIKPLSEDHKLWMPKAKIKDDILCFIGEDVPEFWGYYSSYDWVNFCWLFGAMIDLPKEWPMYCNDLKQLANTVKKPMFKSPVNGHNALSDACWNESFYHYLKN